MCTFFNYNIFETMIVSHVFNIIKTYKNIEIKIQIIDLKIRKIELVYMIRKLKQKIAAAKIIRDSNKSRSKTVKIFLYKQKINNTKIIH